MTSQFPKPPITGSIKSLGLKRRKKYRLRRRNYSLNPVFDPMLEDLDIQEMGGSELKGELDRMRGDLAQAQEGLREAQERALRARADIENQRRRHLKEKDDLRKFAQEDMMRAMLQPMDHFALALQSLDTATDVHAVRQGVEMIHREIMGVLQGYGLEEVVPVGETFDPNLHEAVGTAADPEKPDNTILSVMRSGWVMRGRVLRPAMVQVNKTGATPTPTATPSSISEADFDLDE